MRLLKLVLIEVTDVIYELIQKKKPSIQKEGVNFPRSMMKIYFF